MTTSGLQACLERVKRVEGKVDCQACEGTSLQEFMVSSPRWTGSEKAHNQRSGPQRCHQRWSDFGWEGFRVCHGGHMSRELVNRSESLAEFVPLRDSLRRPPTATFWTNRLS